MEKILIIDNYDSFVYNLVHLLQTLDCEISVKRNDEIEIHSISDYSRIMLSPGPGIPAEAGKLLEIIQTYKYTKPILGVCLGHQAIAESFGGKLINLNEVFHGVADQLYIKDKTDYLFNGLPKKFQVGRYHSWTIDNNLPSELSITAVDQNNQIMGIRHRNLNIRGIQFHPESILTEYGKELIINWITSFG